MTVSRLKPERFYVVSAAATETHDLAWIERHVPVDGSVEVENVTDRYGVLTLAGPRSRELVQRLTADDISREALPFFRARHVEIGGVQVICLRVSYVGELGFELHHPLEHQGELYDRLCEAGADLGLRDFGYRALDSMRLEKAYRLWGADMSADYTPLEAGLERFVAFDKGEFVGREALLARRPSIRLSTLVVDADGADAHGYEPVLADGELISYVMAGRLRAHGRASRSPSPTCRSSTPRTEPRSRSRSSASAARPGSSRNRCTTRRASACGVEGRRVPQSSHRRHTYERDRGVRSTRVAGREGSPPRVGAGAATARRAARLLDTGAERR